MCRAMLTVFDTGHHSKWPFYVLGYGLSLIIAGGTLAIAMILEETEIYFREDACWLNDNSYIWGFKGPVVVVLLGNTLVLARGLQVSCQVVY